MRFQAAAPDARAIVYARVQADPLVVRVATLLTDASLDERLLARAVMNGESVDGHAWQAMFPTVFESPYDGGDRRRAEQLLEVAIEVARRGEELRSQFRGAIVEELVERLVARRVGSEFVKRERRILFDGVRAEIHPYDVTVERDPGAEAWDCKWGARGIGADVLHQVDDARRHAAREGSRLRVGLVVFDARRSCVTRLARLTAPTREIRLVTLETLDQLAGRRPAA